MARTTRAEQHQQLRNFAFDILIPAIPFSISLTKMSKVDSLRAALSSAHKRSYVTTTARVIRDKYGTSCEDLFKILFILHQRGGYSLKKAQGYESMWLYDAESVELNAAFFLSWELSKKANEQFTASDIVKLLVKNGFEPRERVKIYEDERRNKYQEHIASGQELQELKEKRKAQTKEFKSRVKKVPQSGSRCEQQHIQGTSTTSHSVNQGLWPQNSDEVVPEEAAGAACSWPKRFPELVVGLL